MKVNNSPLLDCLRRSMKHFVTELKDRDDHEVEIFEERCAVCGNETIIPKFRTPDQSEWKEAYKQWGIQCKFCADQQELVQVLKKNRDSLHQQLNDRFGRDYWYIPGDLKYAGFKNFKDNGGNSLETKKEAMNYVREFTLKAQEKRSNLLIMGNPGTGKTHLATAIARTIKEKGYLVGQLTTGMLLAKIKATYQKGASQTENSIYDDLRKLDLLVLDDLGAEAKSKDEFDWSKNKMFEIVNLRIGKPTIYTSNFNEIYLSTAIGERIFSRLHNNTKFIELVTEDYRRNLKINS